MAGDVAIIESSARFAPSAIRQFWAYRELLISLTQREIKARYRQSLLGFGWAVVQPLAYMVVFNLVFSRFARVGSEGLPYPIFNYAAMVPWTFLVNALNTTTIGLVSQRSIVTKCYFPREIIVMSQIGARFVDFLAGFAIYGLLMINFGIGLTPWVLLVPVLMLLQVALVLAIGLIASALHVRFRDLAPVVALGLQLWMFLTPVAYSLDQVPVEWRTAFALNPMVGLVDGYRAVLAHGRAPNWDQLALATAVSGALLLVGYLYFKRAELTFADVI